MTVQAAGAILAESIVKYYLITIMEELELIYNTPNISALTILFFNLKAGHEPSYLC